MLQSVEYLEYEFEGGIMGHFLVPHPSGFALLNEKLFLTIFSNQGSLQTITTIQ